MLLELAIVLVISLGGFPVRFLAGGAMWSFGSVSALRPLGSHPLHRPGQGTFLDGNGPVPNRSTAALWCR